MACLKRSDHMPFVPTIHPDLLQVGDWVVLKGNFVAQVQDNAPGEARRMEVDKGNGVIVANIPVDRIMFQISRPPRMGELRDVVAAVSTTKTGKRYV
jgi:hypothetical protein